MLDHYDIETAGKTAVVVGRSFLVGRPMALMLGMKGRDSTVIQAHSRTPDLAAVCRQADILIAAAGVPEFIKTDMVKEGVVIIDVGINRVDDSSTEKGYRLVGDRLVVTVDVVAKATLVVHGGDAFLQVSPGNLGLVVAGLAPRNERLTRAMDHAQPRHLGRRGRGLALELIDNLQARLPSQQAG